MSAVKSKNQVSGIKKKLQRDPGRKLTLRRFISAGVGLSLCAILLWTYFHGAALVMEVSNGVEMTLASIGFQLDDVIVEGRIRTDKEQILKTASLSRGKSLLSIDLLEIKKNLEEIPWVNAASVERRFPDTLFVRISEREPVAIWQNKAKIYLVDREGELIETSEAQKYGGLLQISGLKAPQNVGFLISLLDKFPEIKSRVTTAIHLRTTRWDIRLDGKVDVKLPEKGAEQALAYLLDLEKHHNLMEREILNIDLRIPDQLVLRLTPEAAQKKNNTGKDA
ncbi:FtsQ-type POTRA domain-containing protein [Kamptonema cortianum]|nr:FtsQ-type POTRA domain-containing protein [Geitlerinema splendidum]MDK3161310.1 FtsQ-type POTRA domain-containing protein [Kamptonema cortianum]